VRTCPQCSRTYPDDADFCLRDGTPLPAPAGLTEAALASSLARRYRIVRKLGAGGMGSVFLAEQISLGNRRVALKVLSHKWLDDPDFLQRFHKEGASTARIQHPNVVTIYESGQADDGTPYIAMEYLEGESLSQALRSRGALSVAECAEILQQAARGLNAAHKLGIIHRDLKPDNIFLTYSDDVGVHLAVDQGRGQGPPLRSVVVKLVDFGIAKLRESTTHTLTGMVLGTPAYMSSEQASGMKSDDLDGRSDIYSLGVVVYEMLLGRTPFHSDTPLSYLRKHMLEEPPPFRAAAPGLPVPPQVEATVMKALAKDRDQRYASVLDFARDFALAVAASSPVESLAPTIPMARPVAIGAVQEPPRRDQGATLPPPAPSATPMGGQREVAVQTPPMMPSDPVARPPDLGASVARPEAERRSAQPPAPALPQPDVGAVREPSLRDPVARPQPKETFRTGIASLIAALVVVIVAALAWVYWPGPAKQPSNQPGAPQQATSAPIKPETPILAPSTRTVREPPKDTQKYKWIPPGTFMMGCSAGDNECEPSEKPAHQVTISRGFWMGQTEVTVGAYKNFAEVTQRQMPDYPSFNRGWANENMLIVKVLWNDARAYCRWAGGRLPTEAEWEYAARGGSSAAPYGDLDEIAWYDKNSGGKTHDVAQKAPNGFGLYDMLGNASEWVNDWWGANYYQNSPSQDPPGQATGDWFRVLRGGDWYSKEKWVRVSTRDGVSISGVNESIGFRCVR
jgi:eukaryotic-like serine/threonine-protein kinase